MSSDDAAEARRGCKDRQHKRGSRRPPVSSDDLEDLRELVRTLQAELRAMRRDNELLRRAQLTDPWRYPNPYYHPGAPVTPVAPVASLPLVAPAALGTHESGTASADPVHTPPRQPALTPEVAAMHVDRGPHLREPGDTPDGKRPPKTAARTLEVNDLNDV